MLDKHDMDKIRSCIQCGTCSASCPLSEKMDFAPRGLFALIRDGDLETALASNTPWYCVSCYQCVVRCPQEIPVTDIMYHLKQLALEKGLAPKGHKIPHLYDAFGKSVAQFGRINEPLMMARYGMRHPLDAMKQAPLAVKLFRRGRIETTPQTVQQPRCIADLMRPTKNRGESK